MTVYLTPKEACPACGSDQLIIRDDGARTADSWNVICRDCGAKAEGHCTQPLAIMQWDREVSAIRTQHELASTLGIQWTSPQCTEMRQRREWISK